MHVWLIKDGEPLPTSASHRRLLRTGMLAEALLQKGHTVDWWTSTFDHFGKCHIQEASGTIKVKDGYHLHLLRSPGYKKNISLARVQHQRKVASEFRAYSQGKGRPDLIVCSMPTIELSSSAIGIGKKYKIPVVLDLRDKWPDIFLEVLPKRLRPIAVPFIWGLRQKLKFACRSADGITGIAPDFVSWGLAYAGRKSTASDRHFWLGHERPTTTYSATHQGFWQSLGINPRDFILCYFGAISSKLDLVPILAGARQLSILLPNVKIALCGNGDTFQGLKQEIKDLPNVIAPGWISGPPMKELLQMASVGLVPLQSRQDFVMSIPNKAVEYLSAGLPILSSLKGRLKTLLEKERCGLTYENGNSSDFVEKVLEIFYSTENRAKMSANATRLFESEFCADKVFGEMVQYLETVQMIKAKVVGKNT